METAFPDVALVPCQDPLARQDVAFVDAQESAALPPSKMPIGNISKRVIVGDGVGAGAGGATTGGVGAGGAITGGGVTAFIVIFLFSVPPGPVQANVYVYVSGPISEVVVSEPEMPFVPDHFPEAAQEVAFVAVQLIVAVCPLCTVVGEAIKVICGASTGGATTGGLVVGAVGFGTTGGYFTAIVTDFFTVPLGPVQLISNLYGFFGITATLSFNFNDLPVLSTHSVMFIVLHDINDCSPTLIVSGYAESARTGDLVTGIVNDSGVVPAELVHTTFSV